MAKTKSKPKAAKPCWEPETLPGLAKRFGVNEQQLRMWKSRTKTGSAPTPKSWPDPSYVDSSGKELWDGVEMDAWWSDHPSNPKAKVPADA